ncbi:DNA-directed RNA polymerase, mitochondrial isoform X1 [Bradysia coprophila]|uniref:DNA-directed RNA polymerase, mitochondrial isoform X1 n=1 Tax=Bradysia coprophila TaxID=38358 RepID=UPI00187DACDB|nr:DNA-directed RNA polymerase, mitochondrial isoform X1 [Bradysia coprophila]
MHRLISAKNVTFTNYSFQRNWNICWSCGGLLNAIGSSSTVTSHPSMLSTTPNTDLVNNLKKHKKRRQNKKKWQVELIEVDGKSLINKTATVKSLTSTRLSNFLDYSNKSTEQSTNAGDSHTTFHQNSMINLGRAVFESDETVGEAPALIVGGKSTVDPMKNLQAIIDSYRVFREESLSNSQLDNEETMMIENTDTLEELVPEPMTTLSTRGKKKKKVAGGAVKKTEFNSKIHNTFDDQQAAKHRSLLTNLASYVEMCSGNKNADRGLQALLYYRSKFKQFKLSIDLYNVVLGGFAEKANLPKINEVMRILKTDNIQRNAQSYAAIFECLGRLDASDEHLKILQKFRNDATENGVSLNDIMDLSTFTDNKREIVVEVIQRLDPAFRPIYTPPDIMYNNCLLDAMNKDIQPVEDKDFPQNRSVIKDEKRNFTVEEYQRMFDEQLEIERNGSVKIKSIAKFDTVDDNILYYRSKIEDLHKKWHAAMCKGFVRDIIALGYQAKCKNRFAINIMPYLRLFPEEKYADILLDDIRTLAEGSETFSESIKLLYARIGRKVQNRHFMERKMHNGVLDKTKEIYEQYYKTICEGHSSDNSRQMWQRLVHHNRHCGASMDIVDNPWPMPICIEVGRFLYQILLRDVKIDTNIMRTNSKKSYNLPAFFTIFRTEGKYVREEMKPHPLLAKLHKASQQETLTFDANLIPMLCPPQPWHTSHNGGYILARSDLIRLPSQARQQWDRIKASKASAMYPALDSLNQLGSIAWKVDTKILDVALKVFRNGGSQELNVSQPPSALPPLEFDKSENDPSLGKNKKYEMFKAKMAHLLYRLSLANHYRDKVFWLPHNMDFRGRVYPLPPHLNHLGADLARSLLVFHRAKPLGVDGFSWLKLHCINLTGHKKRESVQNRLQYAEEMMENIIDSADNPLTGRKWWVTSDEPWQTLASCMEITKVLRSPDPTTFMSSFPIHQDGSCNGLQHYAALGRDTAGAVSVNLHPSSVPQDVYSDVAELVEKLRKVDEANGVAIAGILKGYIKRKVIKQTVMTTVYGVTRFGARQQIAKQLKAIDSFPKESVFAASQYLTMKTFESLSEMFTSTKQIQDWFTQSARQIASVRSQNVEWITPLGLPVVQPYHQDLLYKTSGATTLKIDSFAKPNIVKQKNAFPPNFVHSLDSSHMMLTSLHCERAGLTFMSVHDCYWTHACTVPTMNKICREQFVALHSQPILEDLAKFLENRYRFSETELTQDGAKSTNLKYEFNYMLSQPPPDRGTFDLNNVLDSTYFFS